MEEAGDASAEAAVLVVNEGIEDAGLALEGDDIVVGDGGWDEGAGAFTEEDFIACGAYPNLAVTLDAHTDDEAVVLDEVAVEGVGEFGDTHGEIGRVYDEVGAVAVIAILGAVLVFHTEVEGFCCQFGVQFAWLAVHSGTVVVENAVGDI